MKNGAKSRDSFVKKCRECTRLSDWSLRGKLPTDILKEYECHEWKHAAAIMSGDFQQQLNDIIDALRSFRLCKSHILVGGGGKSLVSQSLEAPLVGTQKTPGAGWSTRRWDTSIVLDKTPRDSPTHEVDCVKGKVALEIEWSNKDPFYDRDLNNFRLLFDLRAISVGVIVTKSDELADLFERLGVWSKYGTSTTWMSKLLPRIEGGGGGGCPLLVFGITQRRYDANC